MFQGCSSLESITLSYIDTSSVTSFKSMFRDCSSLKKVDLSHFDTSLAQDMERMFSGCESLENIDLSNFNTSLVTSMGYMFYGCESLKYLDLSYLDTSLVEAMNNMFQNCKNLKVLDISTFNMAELNKAKNMFMNVLNLRYVNIYDVQNTEDYIKESELKNIDNLTICQKEDIILSEKNSYYNCCYFNIETDECESYNYITIYYNQEVTYNNGFNHNYNQISTEIDKFRKEEYFIINKDYFNKINGDSKPLVVNKGIKLEIYFTSDITSLENYFNIENDPNAEFIEKIDLSHLDFSLIESTSKSFYGCKNLKVIDFSNNMETTALNDMNSIVNY